MTTDWVTQLQLDPHPEGGHYRRVFTSPDTVVTANGPRPTMTAIFYRLGAGDFSAWHRLKNHELWHFHHGDALYIHTLSNAGVLTTLTLNADTPLQSVAANTWFAAEPVPGGEHGQTLVSCTVTPGFDFVDFEMGNREHLVTLYPRHLDVICRLTRD